MENQDLMQSLTTLVQAIIDGKNFAVEQAPDVIQQVLLYHTIVYSILVGIGIGLAVIAMKLYSFRRAIITQGKKDCYDGNDTPLANAYQQDQEVSYSLAVLITSVASFAFLSNIFYLVKITLAPKVWLIEYAASLIK